MLALKYDYIKDYVEKYGGGDTLISKEYVVGKKLSFLCSRCGKEYSSSFGNFKNLGNRCKRCSMETLWNKSRRNKEDVIRVIEENNYKVIEDFNYQNNKTKINIEDCEGYRYFVPMTNFEKTIETNRGFNKFHPGNPHSIYNVNIFLKNNNKPCSVIDGEYKNFSSKTLVVRCDKRGHIYTTSFSLLYSGGKGSGCSICAGRTAIAENSFMNEYPQLMEEWSPKNTLNPENVTKGTHTKVWWICKNGHDDYFASLVNRVYGRGCPLCGFEQTESKIATELKLYCIEIFGEDDVDLEHRLIKNPKTNYWLRNDIFIKSLRLHIEIMGSQHYKYVKMYHLSYDAFLEQQYRDELKRKEIERLGDIYLEINTKELRKINTIKRFFDEYLISLGKEVYIDN